MPALRQFRQARQLRLRRAPRVPSGAFRKAHAPHVLPLVARVEAQIRAEFERMTALVLSEIGPILLAKGAKRDAVSLPELWRTLHSTLRPQAILKKLFNQVNAETDRALAARLPTLPIAAVVSNGPQLEERWIRKNVDLIQVEPRVQRAVEHVLAKPLAEGVRVEDLKQQLQERLGIEARRAELIARDQTLKLAGQLQQARQTQAGIRRYVWTTSEDERVRPDHAKLDGTVQSWDAPPIVDSRTGRRAHPGGDFACRCNADPQLDEPLEPSLAAPLPPETELTPGFEPGAEPAAEAEAAPEAPLELPEDIASAQAAFAAEQQAALEAEQARRAAAQQAEAEAERLRLEARIAEVRAAAEREAAAETAVRAKAAATAQSLTPTAVSASSAADLLAAAQIAGKAAQRPEILQAIAGALPGKSLADLGAIPFTAADLESDGSLRFLRADPFFAATGNVADNFGSSKGGLPQITIEADGTVLLSNGRHRLTVARELGLRQIVARIRKLGPRGGVVWEYVGLLRV